ncbi:MAG: hypothetical protein V4510_08430 [bacterium]
MLRTFAPTLALVALAGCVFGGGDSGGAADVSYDGTDNGTHSETARCNSDGTLTGSGKIDNGQVRITVTDGSGNQMFSNTYSSSFDAGAESMHGASGGWTVQAVRSGSGLVGTPFSGNYHFHLAC